MAQVSCLGVLGSTAYASIILDIADSPLPQQDKAPDFKAPKQFPKFPSKPDDVTLEDVELLEKSGKCKLVLIDKSGKKLNPLQWFEEKKKKKPELEKHWRDKVTYDIWYQKQNCKEGKYVTLELDRGGDEVHGSFKLKNILV